VGFPIDLDLMIRPKRPVTFEPRVVEGFIRDAVHDPGLAFEIPYTLQRAYIGALAGERFCLWNVMVGHHNLM